MTEKRNMIGIFGNFRELSTLGIANILTTAIGGIFWLYIANLLGAEKYGEISYILGIAGIAVTLSSLGSNNTIIVFVAKGEKIHAPISLLVIAVGIISSFIIFNIFEDFGAGIYVLGSLIFGLVTSEFLGLKMYKNYAGLVVSQRILMICLSIILYHIIGHDGIIFGIGLSFFPYTYRLYHFFKDRTVDFSLIKEKKSFIGNSFVLDLRPTFIGSVDKIMIAPLLGFVALGNYQLGLQIFSVLMIVPTIVYQYALPQEAGGNVKPKLKIITIIVSIILVFLGITLSPILSPILFPEFSDASIIIQIMSLAAIPNSIVSMYLIKFLSIEKNKFIFIGTLTYLLTNILGIVLLGKTFGITGIGWAFVLAFTAEASCFVILNKFYLKESENTS